MSELKIGTLALVHGLIRDVEYNGKCVELIEPVTDPNDWFFLDAWNCSVSDNENAYFPSRNLLPIGDKDPNLEYYKEKDLDNELRKSTEYS